MRSLGSLLFICAAAHGAEPEPAELRIVTQPAGIAITIDGALVGLSPRTQTLPPGVHTITAESAAANASQTLQLGPGEKRTLQLSLTPPGQPRAFPVVGAVTFGGGALAFGLGLLLQLPARAAGRDVSQLIERGGGWDDRAKSLEAGGLAAQTWSWVFTVTGAAVMASGLFVTFLQLFGTPGQPQLVLVPTPQGGLVSWSGRW